jgi:hypothetical protein
VPERHKHGNLCVRHGCRREWCTPGCTCSGSDLSCTSADTAEGTKTTTIHTTFTPTGYTATEDIVTTAADGGMIASCIETVRATKNLTEPGMVELALCSSTKTDWSSEPGWLDLTRMAMTL